MALLEKEVWVAQFATVLQERAPNFPRTMALDIGAHFWPWAGLLPPSESVIRFLALMADASKDLRAGAEGADVE